MKLITSLFSTLLIITICMFSGSSAAEALVFDFNPFGRLYYPGRLDLRTTTTTTTTEAPVLE